MFEAVMMQTEQGRRRERASDWGRDDVAGWELVAWVELGVACVEEEDVGQDFLGRLWAVELLLVRVLLP